MNNVGYKLLVAVSFAATVVEIIMAVKSTGDALLNLMCIAGVTAFVFAMSLCGYITEVGSERSRASPASVPTR